MTLYQKTPKSPLNFLENVILIEENMITDIYLYFIIFGSYKSIVLLLFVRQVDMIGRVSKMYVFKIFKCRCLVHDGFRYKNIFHFKLYNILSQKFVTNKQFFSFK